MISYRREILDNGLTVLLHKDCNTPLVTVNTLFKVGARNEQPTLTGFAHLFEHLMFGGTKAVPDYDRVVNSLGGDSNAFTNNDYTNYYLTLPLEHLESALRIEADRMRGLDLTQKALSVQQKVVTEEYHQRYENQPYGDVWMLLRPLCYRVHPYRWCTIGADIRHVQQATLADVRDFFECYYRPNNAIVAVVGNIDEEQTLRWIDRYYGSIPAGKAVDCALEAEPEPDLPHLVEVERDVPSNALYRAYLMCDYLHPDMFAFDAISDILSNGDSTRLYRRLVKEQKLFTEVDACITGERDRGLFLLSGKLCDGVDFLTAERAIEAELADLDSLGQHELQKVVSKFESTFVFSHYKAADRAQSLCFYEYLGHTDWVNTLPSHYRQLTVDDLVRVAHSAFCPSRANTLRYRKKQ